MRGLTIEQLQRTLTSFLRHGRGSFDLARMYSDIEDQGTVGDHLFAAPPTQILLGGANVEGVGTWVQEEQERTSAANKISVSQRNNI